MEQRTQLSLSQGSTIRPDPEPWPGNHPHPQRQANEEILGMCCWDSHCPPPMELSHILAAWMDTWLVVEQCDSPDQIQWRIFTSGHTISFFLPPCLPLPFPFVLYEWRRAVYSNKLCLCVTKTQTPGWFVSWKPNFQLSRSSTRRVPRTANSESVPWWRVGI